MIPKGKMAESAKRRAEKANSGPDQRKMETTEHVKCAKTKAAKRRAKAKKKSSMEQIDAIGDDEIAQWTDPGPSRPGTKYPAR